MLIFLPVHFSVHVSVSLFQYTLPALLLSFSFSFAQVVHTLLASCAGFSSQQLYWHLCFSGSQN